MCHKPPKSPKTELRLKQARINFKLFVLASEIFLNFFLSIYFFSHIFLLFKHRCLHFPPTPALNNMAQCTGFHTSPSIDTASAQLFSRVCPCPSSSKKLNTSLNNNSTMCMFLSLVAFHSCSVT